MQMSELGAVNVSQSQSDVHPLPRADDELTSSLKPEDKCPPSPPLTNGDRFSQMQYAHQFKRQSSQECVSPLQLKDKVPNEDCEIQTGKNHKSSTTDLAKEVPQFATQRTVTVREDALLLNQLRETQIGRSDCNDASNSITEKRRGVRDSIDNHSNSMIEKRANTVSSVAGGTGNDAQISHNLAQGVISVTVIDSNSV